MLQPGCRARLGERRFAAPASTPESIRKGKTHIDWRKLYQAI